MEDRIFTVVEDEKLVNNKTSEGRDSYNLTFHSNEILEACSNEEEILLQQTPNTKDTNTPMKDTLETPFIQNTSLILTNLLALKEFCMDESLTLRKKLDVLKEIVDERNVKENNLGMIGGNANIVDCLHDENNNKNIIIKTLLENQNHLFFYKNNLQNDEKNAVETKTPKGQSIYIFEKDF